MSGVASLQSACRPLTAAAAGKCAALHAGGFGHPWPAAEFESLLASAAVVADGMSEGAELQGFVLSRRAVDEAEILTIVVNKAARRRGVASGLLGIHIARLASLGVAKLFLEVDEGNQPARALYRRFGFEQVGRRTAYYLRPDGSRANALILKLEL